MARCLSECNVRLVYSLLGGLRPGFACSTSLVGRCIALQGVYLYPDVQQLIDLHEGRPGMDVEQWKNLPSKSPCRASVTQT